jgi:hypothetical protein
MPAPVKPGNPERYWREVDGLSRLDTALLRDPDLSDEERGPLLAALNAFKDKLVEVARSRVEASATVPDEAPAAPAVRAGVS